MVSQKKPNFIIIGSCAGGTSFLTTILSQHKDIYFPKIWRPEPNFFHYSHKYEKGINFYIKKWFSKIKKEKAIGERSSLLLTSKLAPKRIHKHFPNIKIIACLRNPSERAWANYRFTCLEGLEENGFLTSLKIKKNKRNYKDNFWNEVYPHGYIERSLYSRGVERFVKLFGEKNVLLLKSESLNENMNHEIHKVCKFLKVKKNFIFKRPLKYSSPNVINLKEQIKLRNKYGIDFYKLTERIRTNTLNDKKFRDIYKNINFKKKKLPLNAKILLRKKFQKDVKKLQKYINFKVDDWK